MANKFVRNVTGTKLTGEKKEPFYTNVQNDILSDDEDIYIRQEKSEKVDDNYHCLTDNIKTVQGTSTVGVSTVDKNTVKLNPQLATENEAIEGTNNSKIMTPERVKQAVKEHETETVITSDDETVTVTKNGKNNYDLSIEKSDTEDNSIDLTDIESLVDLDDKKIYIKFTPTRALKSDESITLSFIIKFPNEFRTNRVVISSNLMNEDLGGYMPQVINGKEYRNTLNFTSDIITNKCSILLRIRQGSGVSSKSVKTYTIIPVM